MGSKHRRKHLVNNGFVPIREALDEAFSEIDKFHEDEHAKTDLSSGYEFLDSLLVGIEAPRFSIISVPTAFCESNYLSGSIVANLGMKYERAVGCFTMQVSSAYYSTILLSMVSNVNLHLLRSGRLESELWPDLSRAAGAIAETNIYVDDYRTQSIKSIRESAQQMMKSSKIELLVIDNLQNMFRKHRPGRRAFEYQQICQSLRELSWELDVSILLMSELSDVTHVEDVRLPGDCAELSTLREYTRIADAELCLIPDESGENKRPSNLYLYRNREGFTGTIKLGQDYPLGGFHDNGS